MTPLNTLHFTPLDPLKLTRQMPHLYLHRVIDEVFGTLSFNYLTCNISEREYILQSKDWQGDFQALSNSYGTWDDHKAYAAPKVFKQSREILVAIVPLFLFLHDEAMGTGEETFWDMAQAEGETKVAMISKEDLTQQERKLLLSIWPDDDWFEPNDTPRWPE
jgi:hypothetical protein